MTQTTYSIVIPTFRRGESLAECLESIVALDYPRDHLEVIVVDNGGPANTSGVAAVFADRIRLRYLVNDKNRGYGYSANRGIVESVGDRILMLNDDARPFPDLLKECDRLLNEDRTIGCVGCRAIEDGYVNAGEGIGRIDPSGEVVANFNLDCGEPIEVDHVYGFCYAFTRDALERAGLNDHTLLARPYSTGDRIETDHCLSIKRAGLKVVFNPRMVARHLATPRADMSERSLRWKLNSIRNTLYLFLKHYGLMGNGAVALRFTFLRDVGLISLVKQPTSANLRYFLNGLRARASAFAHYVLYLTTERLLDLRARTVR